MGLLDEAIREHLELKRKRGADPAEVAEQEREALGPVRGADTATAEPPASEIDVEPEPPPVADAEPEHEFHGAVRAPDPEPEPEEHVSQPTQQYSVDEIEELRDPPPPPAPEPEQAAPTGEDPGEDVLDETPDFLQEAPEHDRLWFEQRPPRDFDF